MNPLGPYGVVLSGGGALAAWEVGCLRSIVNRYDQRYPMVMTGASAGALNAAGLALGMSIGELQEAWRKLTPPSIFRARPRERTWAGLLTSILARTVLTGSVVGGIQHAASGIHALYDTRPLANTLRTLLQPRYDNLQQFDGAVAFAVTSLEKNAKKYYYFSRQRKMSGDTWHLISGYEVLEGALIASTAIPILFPPLGQDVDGGVLRNQPLGAADELLDPGLPIYVLIPQPDRLPGTLTLDVLPGRLLSTWLTQGFSFELAHLRILNLARTGLGEAPRPVCVVRASVDLETLGSGLLAFGKEVSTIVDRGQRDADPILKGFSATDATTWAEELRP